MLDNTADRCHIESSFPGHLNDAQSFILMTDIGGPDLMFADEIYSNRHPLMDNPFTR